MFLIYIDFNQQSTKGYSYMIFSLSNTIIIAKLADILWQMLFLLDQGLVGYLSWKKIIKSFQCHLENRRAKDNKES